MNRNHLHSRKAMQGISVMFVFLAIVLIATAISGVLLFQSNKMVQQGQTNYKAASKQFKSLQIAEVAGYDGRAQELSLLTIDVKALIDSGYLSFDDLTIAIHDKNQRTTLMYRGVNAPIEESNNGYITYAPQEFGELTYTSTTLPLFLSVQDDVPYVLPLDLDNDGLFTDTVEVCDDDASGAACPANYDGSYLLFDLSGSTQDYYAALRNQDGTLANISTGSAVVDVVNSPISGGFGYISVSGTISIPYEIDAGFTFLLDKQGYLIKSDLDGDTKNDYLRLNETHMILNISSSPNDLSYPLGVDLSSGATSIDTSVKLIDETNTVLGTVVIAGNTSAADIIDEDVTFTINPIHAGTGYYVVKHLFESDDYLPGRLVKGDVVRFYLATYQNLTNDDIISIDFIYANSEIIGKTIYVGNTFPNTWKVVLFPKP